MVLLCYLFLGMSMKKKISNCQVAEDDNQPLPEEDEPMEEGEERQECPVDE